MGLVAPVAAVLSAGIPDYCDRVCGGLSGHLVTSSVLFSLESASGSSHGPKAGAGRPEGLGMAVLAGIGFAGFYLCVHRAGNASRLCGSPPARGPASFLVTASIVLFGRQIRAIPMPVLAIAVVAGIFDITGSVGLHPRVRKSDAWTMRSCSVHSIPRLRLCWLASFCTSTSAARVPSAWLAALAAVPMIAG